MKELKSILQDAAGFELVPGKRYLVFIDPAVVNMRDLLQSPAFSEGDDYGDIMFVPCKPDQQTAVRDSISVYELEERSGE